MYFHRVSHILTLNSPTGHIGRNGKVVKLSPRKCGTFQDQIAKSSFLENRGHTRNPPGRSVVRFDQRKFQKLHKRTRRGRDSAEPLVDTRQPRAAIALAPSV